MAITSEVSGTTVRKQNQILVHSYRSREVYGWLFLLLSLSLAAQAQTTNPALAGDQQSGQSTQQSGGKASTVSEEEIADPASYCATLAGTTPPPTLAHVCEFALAMRTKLPDVICDQKTKRVWRVEEDSSEFPGSAISQYHSEQITMKVSFREGKEFYDDVRVNDRSVNDTARVISAASWSIGEFASILRGIFTPSSKTEFQYKKEETLKSNHALVWSFYVKAENNKTFFLELGGKVWFPEYQGKLWIDEKTFDLLKLERETVNMLQGPVRSMQTQVDYNKIVLGDGTNLVLPIHANVTTCPSDDKCSQSEIQFANWQKFHATTKIVSSPD